MICKKCGKRYDDTWKLCLSCSEELVQDSSPEGMATPKTSHATSDIANPEYYLKQFKKFDENDGKFCITWNWAAAIFNWIWQLCRSLRAKWIVYGIVFTSLSFLIQYLPIEFMMHGMIALWVFGFVFYGCVSNYDYYLKKKHNENLWPWLPWTKFKWPFWIAALFFALVWGSFVAKGFTWMGTTTQRLLNPVLATGQSYKVDSIRYTPIKGWQMLGRMPQMMPGIRMKNEQLFLIGDHSGMGTPKPDRFGQVALFIGWPKKGERFESLEQEEVKKMVDSTYSAQSNPMFKIMSVESTVSMPESIDINGRKWLKAHHAFGFKGQDEGVMSIAYYTIGADRLIMLSFSGASAEKQWASRQLEEFASTFEFDAV